MGIYVIQFNEALECNVYASASGKTKMSTPDVIQIVLLHKCTSMLGSNNPNTILDLTGLRILNLRYFSMFQLELRCFGLSYALCFPSDSVIFWLCVL